MPGLISYVSSASFVNEMMELRQQVMEGQIGGFLLGGERVRVSYMPDTGRFLAESEGRGRVYAELLNIAFNDGVNVLRNRILSALPGMGGRNSLQEKYRSVPLLSILKNFNVLVMRFNVQLHWSSLKMVFSLRIQEILRFAPCLIRFLFLIWSVKVGFTH